MIQRRFTFALHDCLSWSHVFVLNAVMWHTVGCNSGHSPTRNSAELTILLLRSHNLPRYLIASDSLVLSELQNLLRSFLLNLRVHVITAY